MQEGRKGDREEERNKGWEVGRRKGRKGREGGRKERRE